LLGDGRGGIREAYDLGAGSDKTYSGHLVDLDGDGDLDVVISNDADGVHWDTGIPAAYTPMPVKPLTGEVVDDVEIYRRMPCALLRAGGAIVISSETTFSTVNRTALEDLVASGSLRVVSLERATIYLATDSACDG
jgi:hypothetical protein